MFDVVGMYIDCELESRTRSCVTALLTGFVC
jgi:hypothetical protein